MMQSPTSLAAWTPARAPVSATARLAMMQPPTSPAAWTPARASVSAAPACTASVSSTATTTSSSGQHRPTAHRGSSPCRSTAVQRHPEKR
eukprot:10432824-Alexandrium_andersonii.AAC.1